MPQRSIDGLPRHPQNAGDGGSPRPDRSCARRSGDRRPKARSNAGPDASALRFAHCRPGPASTACSTARAMRSMSARREPEEAGAELHRSPPGCRIGCAGWWRRPRALEIVVTHTEVEALLLECNLIKRLMPRYNVLLRDDKSFPFIHLTADHDFPAADQASRRAQPEGEYFGPFASAGAVNRTLIALQKAFLLRSCSDTVFANRTRPCLLYQIKRCSAPCVGRIGEDDYAGLIEQARRFLSAAARRCSGSLAGGDGRGRGGARFRGGGADPRPHPRAVAGAGPPGHPRRRHRRRRRDRRPSGRRPHLHPGVLLPRRPAIGATAPISRATTGSSASRRC